MQADITFRAFRLAWRLAPKVREVLLLLEACDGSKCHTSYVVPLQSTFSKLIVDCPNEEQNEDDDTSTQDNTGAATGDCCPLLIVDIMLLGVSPTCNASPSFVYKLSIPKFPEKNTDHQRSWECG